MIGNDIIDLGIARAERKSENQRYIKKVFTSNEESQILNSKDAELRLWQFWSMKEAAYKAHQRNFDLPRKVNPRSFECSLNTSGDSGSVSIDDSVYDIQFEITSEYIHAFSINGNIYKKIFRTNGESSIDLVNELSKISINNSKDYVVKKDRNGIPTFQSKLNSCPIPFSISHHGKFTALSIPLINS